MARMITPAERELDLRLAKFGLGQHDQQAALGSEADSGNQPPADDSATPDDLEQEGLSDKGEEGDNSTDGDGEGPNAQEDQQAPGGDASENPVNHNWEKRAKDNQRSYFREKSAREKMEREYQARVADLEAKLRQRTQAIPEDDEDFEQLAQANPEVAEFYKKREAKRVEQDIEDIHATMQVEFKQHLTGEVPDWQQTIATPEFKKWKDAQPKSTRRIMEQTFSLDQDGSFLYEPTDVIGVLERFKASGKGYVPSVPDEGQAQPARTPGNQPVDQNSRTDVFSVAEMNDPNLSDKFMRSNGKDRKTASEAFDKKYWRSVTYWRSKGFNSV